MDQHHGEFVPISWLVGHECCDRTQCNDAEMREVPVDLTSGSLPLTKSLRTASDYEYACGLLAGQALFFHLMLKLDLGILLHGVSIRILCSAWFPLMAVVFSRILPFWCYDPASSRHLRI